MLAYLPLANRHCDTCGCTKAVPEAIARRRADFMFIPTHACDTCGDSVEAEVAHLIQRQHKKQTYVPACYDCGTPEGLISAEVNLPDGMGMGWIYLCASCLTRYDEGQATWAH